MYQVGWDKRNKRWEAYLAECTCHAGKKCETCEDFDPYENYGIKESKFHTLAEAIQFRNQLNDPKPYRTLTDVRNQKAEEMPSPPIVERRAIDPKVALKDLEMLGSASFPPCPTIERWCVRAIYRWQVDRLTEVLERHKGTMTIELTYLGETITMKDKLEASANGVTLLTEIFGSKNIMFRYEEWAL